MWWIDFDKCLMKPIKLVNQRDWIELYEHAESWEAYWVLQWVRVKKRITQTQ